MGAYLDLSAYLVRRFFFTATAACDGVINLKLPLRELSLASLLNFPVVHRPLRLFFFASFNLFLCVDSCSSIFSSFTLTSSSVS